MVDFNSPESVSEWLQANDGVEGLRQAIDTGRFAGKHKIEAEACLRKHDREQIARTEQVNQAREERNVRAAEVSAKWAKWLTIIAVAALVVGVIEYCASK